MGTGGGADRGSAVPWLPAAEREWFFPAPRPALPVTLQSRFKETTD